MKIPVALVCWLLIAGLMLSLAYVLLPVLGVAAILGVMSKALDGK